MLDWFKNLDRNEKKIQLAANIYIHLCSNQGLANPEEMAARAFVMADAFMEELTWRIKNGPQ